MSDYTFTVTLDPGETARASLEQIPGVRFLRSRWAASWHALPAVVETATSQGQEISIRHAPENIPVPRSIAPWEPLEARLREGGEVLEAYLTTWPLDYQKEALGFASQLPGTLLHHPTGSGKTYTAILWGLLEHGPLVIVTRASTRVQYAREVERFTRLRAYVCKPATEVRKRDKWRSLGEYLAWCQQENQRPAVVVGWESLPWWADEIAAMVKDAGAGNVVFDESHKGKSKKRWEAVPIPDKDSPDYDKVMRDVDARNGVIKESKDGDGSMVGLLPMGNVVETATRVSRAATRRLATTATPVPDRVRDLWGQLDLLEPFAWGSYWTFAHRYCDARPGEYGGLDDRGQSNLTELDARLSMVMHTVPVAVARANLPPKRRQTWYIAQSEQVEPTGGWQRVIKAAKARGASALLEVRLAMAASAKRRAIAQRVGEYMESGYKVVIFTARKRDAEELAEGLSKLAGKSKPSEIWCGHGDHSQDERRAMLRGYQASPGACVLVGTGEAWGTGIDGLQCTDILILAMLPPTPGALDQQEGRTTRHGQDRPVTVLYPVAEGTADEHLASILIDKLPAVEALVGIESLAGAADALAGTEHNSEAFAAGVLAALRDAEVEDDNDE